MLDTAVIIGPAFLLLAVVAGHLLTIFEPYFALRTAEGIELMEYHYKDLKLRRIAEWWTAKLANQEGGWYDDSDEAARHLCAELHYSLVRHRFLFGDDPGKLRCGQNYLSSLLAKALHKLGWVKNPSAAGSSKRGADGDDGEEETVMLISPDRVEIAGGKVIWRGKPPEYRSRFCDMYHDYEPL